MWPRQVPGGVRGGPMRPMKILLALVAAVALGVVYAAPAPAATTTHFSCTQTTAGRATQKQSVTGDLTGSTPPNVTVTRLKTSSGGSAIEFGPVPNPPLHNDDPFTYWHNTYGLNGWDLGETSAAPFGPRHGYL